MKKLIILFLLLSINPLYASGIILNYDSVKKETNPINTDVLTGHPQGMCITDPKQEKELEQRAKKSKWYKQLKNQKLPNYLPKPESLFD